MLLDDQIFMAWWMMLHGDHGDMVVVYMASMVLHACMVAFFATDMQRCLFASSLFYMSNCSRGLTAGSIFHGISISVVW